MVRKQITALRTHCFFWSDWCDLVAFFFFFFFSFLFSFFSVFLFAPTSPPFFFFLCVCVEIASISERRIERLVNPVLSSLPAFLVNKGGLHSGFMIASVFFKGGGRRQSSSRQQQQQQGAKRTSPSPCCILLALARSHIFFWSCVVLAVRPFLFIRASISLLLADTVPRPLSSQRTRLSAIRLLSTHSARLLLKRTTFRWYARFACIAFVPVNWGERKESEC